MTTLLQHIESLNAHADVMMAQEWSVDVQVD